MAITAATTTNTVTEKRKSGPKRRRPLVVAAMAALVLAISAVILPGTAGAAVVTSTGGKGQSYAYCDSRGDTATVRTIMQGDMRSYYGQYVETKVDAYKLTTSGWQLVKSSNWARAYLSGTVYIANFNANFYLPGQATYAFVSSYRWKADAYTLSGSEGVRQFVNSSGQIYASDRCVI